MDNTPVLYCLLLHAGPRQIARLFTSLYNRTDIFVLHLDCGAGEDCRRLAARFAATFANVQLISTRACCWGGFSIVEATQDLLRLGLLSDARWQHAVLLSGTHLPLWPLPRIRAWLRPGLSVFEATVLRSDAENDPRGATWNRQMWKRVLWDYEEVPGARARRVREAPPPPFAYALGSQWVVLARHHAAYATRTGPDPIRDRLASTEVADEAFYPTVLLNSPMRDERIDATSTFSVWSDGRSHPETLGLDEYRRHAASGKVPFIRKMAEDLGDEREAQAAVDHAMRRGADAECALDRAMMEAIPTISVAMATCNGGAHLAMQLASLAAQTLAPDELIIGDDGSEDDTVAVIQRFAETAPFPVRLNQNPRRMGYARNFMQTAARCAGDLIFFADQDDVWRRDKIETVAAFAGASPKLAFFHDMAVFPETRQRRIPSYHAYLRDQGLPAAVCFKGCCLAIKKEFINLWGWPEGESAVSHDFWIALLAFAFQQSAVIDRILIDHRLHAANASGWLAASAGLTGATNPTRRTADAATLIELCLRDWNIGWADAFNSVVNRKCATDGTGLTTEVLALLEENKAHWHRRGAPKPMKQAILYRAHQINDRILQEVARLKAELPAYDIAIVGYTGSIRIGTPLDVPVHLYGLSDLRSLPFGDKLVPLYADSTVGMNDLPVLMFFREHAEYDYYWVIEYDVRYTGDWSALFSELSVSRADLLCTHLQSYAGEPEWWWWPTLRRRGVALPENDRMKGFMPFARLSRKLLQRIDAAYQDGWTGHYEATWPSIGRTAGLVLEDIGGEGPFTPGRWRCKHYRRGGAETTFTDQPAFPERVFEQPIREALLWHPVK